LTAFCGGIFATVPIQALISWCAFTGGYWVVQVGVENLKMNPSQMSFVLSQED